MNKQREYDVKCVSSVVDVICSWGRGWARAKLGGMCFCTLPRPMFWYSLPATVIVGRLYRGPAISTDEWLDK